MGSTRRRWCPAQAVRGSAARLGVVPIQLAPSIDQQQAFVLDPRPPAGPGWQAQPGPSVNSATFRSHPAQSPVAAAAHDVAVAIGRAAGRRGQVAVEDGKLHEPVEQPQRLVVGDMLLGLRREDVRQQQVGRRIRHGLAFRM